MKSPLRHYLNPFHPAGGYIVPHAVITAIVLFAVFVFGFLSGWESRTVFDAHYFKARYSFPGVHEPRSKVPAAVPEPVIPRALPRQASIDISRYPAVGDQGQIGSCAAWATAWAYSFEYRRTHLHSGLRFSPRYMYDHYSDTYNNGQDGGSWPDQNLETASTYGTPRFTQLPYPPYQIDQSIPAVDAYGHSLSADAAKLRLPVQIHALTGFSVGPGQGAVDALRATLNGVNTADGKPHPVLVALEVTQEYDNATQQPLIVYNANSYNRGGHENVILAYDDSLQFPDGSVGGVEVQNQWSPQWGRGGRAWLSYDFIRQVTFGLEYLTIGTAAPGRSPIVAVGPKPRFLPNPAPVHAPPSSAPTTPPTTVSMSTSWYVHNVPGYENGRTVDLAPLINANGDQYHVWPVAIAATVYTESAGNVFAYRWIEPLDKSCGLMQQIVANIALYEGITNEAAACQWEYAPQNSIMLGTKMLAQCAAYHGYRVPWPNQYVFYNGGCGLSDSTAMYPYGDYYAHFVGFLRNYNYALAQWAGGSQPQPQPKPKPKPIHHPFPARAYGHKPYRTHGHLTWPASVWVHHQQLGRYQSQHYYRGRHGGWMAYRFLRGRINCSLGLHRCSVKT